MMFVRLGPSSLKLGALGTPIGVSKPPEVCIRDAKQLESPCIVGVIGLIKVSDFDTISIYMWVDI